MTTLQLVPDLVAPRQAALRSLDAIVRQELAAAAGRWGLDGARIDLTAYDRVYNRAPHVGGHWTLFAVNVTGSSHEVATVTVAAEFDGAALADLRVSGARDAVAGGCTPQALNEALGQCGGPLRQRTPLTVPTGSARRADIPVGAPSLN